MSAGFGDETDPSAAKRCETTEQNAWTPAFNRVHSAGFVTPSSYAYLP
jgi:hypothetical protein